MSDEPVILINLLKAKPGKQDALIALLKQNTDTVIRTLHGWKTSRLIAAKDGAGVNCATPDGSRILLDHSVGRPYD
jgi:hypothetical protein